MTRRPGAWRASTIRSAGPVGAPACRLRLQRLWVPHDGERCDARTAGVVWQQITARNADLALTDAVRGLDQGAGGGAIGDHRDYDPLMGRLWTISAEHAGANRLNVSYNYDADGLVMQRITSDETVQIDETFDHDALHRLIHTTRNGMPLQNGLPFSVSMDETYDSVGNRIDSLQNGTLIEHRGYGSNGQQPYALTERDVSDPANPNAAAAGAEIPLRRARTVEAGSASPAEVDRVRSAVERDRGRTGLDVPLRQPTARASRRAAPTARPQRSPVSMKSTRPARPSEHVFHVIGSDEAVADVTYTEAANPTLPGTSNVAYPLTDALGSTDAIVDTNGTSASTTTSTAGACAATPTARR